MIASLAAACLAAGIAIGYVLARRFWLRAWVGLILTCTALTLAVFVGAFPMDAIPGHVAAAVLVLLVPLIGLIAWYFIGPGGSKG